MLVVGLCRASFHDGVVGHAEVHLEAVDVVAVVEAVGAVRVVAHPQASMHVHEDVCVDAEGDEDDGEAPAVGQRVSQVHGFWGDPAPVARDGLIEVEAKSRKAWSLEHQSVTISGLVEP